VAIVDELITLLGFDVDDSGAKSFQSAMGGVKKVTVAVGAAIAVAEAAVLSFTAAVAAETDELGKFSDSFGVSSSRLQQFEFATERAGGSAAELRGDIASLTKTLASPIPGEFNQGLFNLGVNVKNSAGELKSADEILLDLSDRFSGFSAQQRQILSTQAGLSESTIRFISQGREEIERLSAKATALGGILPDEATEIAAEYADRLTDVNFALNGIGKTVSISLLPGLTRGLEKFESWIIANREFTSQGISEIVEGIGDGFNFVFETISSGVDSLKSAFPGLEGLTERIDFGRLAGISLTTIIGTLVVVFSPLIAKVALVVAGISGLILIIDDLVAFVKGEKSVIGTLFDGIIEKFPAIGPVIENVKGLFVDLVDAVAPIFIGLGVAINETFKAISDDSTLWGQIFEGAVNLVIGNINTMVSVIRTALNLFKSFATFISGDVTSALEILGEESDRWSEIFGENIDKVSGWIDTLLLKIESIGKLWDSVKESLSVEELSVIGEDIGVAAGEIVGEAKDFAGEQIDSLSRVGQDIGAAATGLLEAIGFGGGGEERAEAESAIKGFVPPGPTLSAVAPAGSVSNVSNSKDISQTNNNVFNISGAQNPQATATAVTGALGRQQSSLSTAAQTGAYPGLE
jgi:hypothetical protein